MKTIIVAMALVLVIAAPAMAQEPEPTLAEVLAAVERVEAQNATIIAQNDLILAALDAGVKLNPEQGSVHFSGQVFIECSLEHDACFKVVNALDYAIWARAKLVAALLEAPILGSLGVGLWANGDGSGFLATANQFNGIQAQGGGYGISASGGSGATYPEWGGAAQCTVDPAAIASSVWEEDVRNHTTPCSAGAVLAGKRCR